MQSLEIQDVVSKTGLSAHTLRYYERIGLIAQVDRAANGHRRYTEQDMAWINFLICLRATGMSISQMKHYAELHQQGDSTVSERREMLEKHRCSIEQRIGQLETHLERVNSKIKLYFESEKNH